MVKCLECGFESTRLQWTHFKYNCTGRFANGREYLACYPGEKLVDAEVAKKTAVTLENLINKYGPDEGKVRWNSYRNKQAHTNSYEYKKEKYGWTIDQFNEYNSSRAQTLEKMLKRYGETVGVIRWEEYCARQAYTNTKNYFIDKYGAEAGTRKYLEINKKKAVSNPVYLAEKLSITVQEATEIILARQKQFFTSDLEQEFVSLLETKIGKLDHTTTNKPFGKWSALLETYVVYDVKHKNCIIEFNGDYWHANPKTFSESAIIRGKTAKEIRHRDQLKLQTARDLGFDVLVVWESDFKANKSKTIDEVAAWILKDPK